MKHLHTFNVFEGMIFESTGSYFRFSAPLPKTQAELDVINGYPEFETMRQILSIRSKSDNWVYRTGPIEFSFKKGGGLSLPYVISYGLSLTRNGAIQYGGYAVGPSTNFRIQDWHQLIDFMSLYIISKSLSGVNISHIDKFVFDGKPPSINLLKSLDQYGYLEIITKMAKKYNDTTSIDASLLSAKQKSDTFITDTGLIEKTEIFKWLAPIFGITRGDKENSGCVTFITEFKSPYGILDPIMRIYSRAFNICLEGRGPRVIRVKTLKRLENAVNGYLEKNIGNGQQSDIIKTLNDKMIDFVISQRGETISKESLIQKFKSQIEEAISERFMQMIKVGQWLGYNTNALDLDEIAGFIQTVKENFAIDLEDSPDIANSITSEFIRILNSPYEHTKIAPFVQTAMKYFGIDLNDPLVIADGIERDPKKLFLIYDKLDPQITEEIFRIMDVNKNDMESMRIVRDMGLL